MLAIIGSHRVGKSTLSAALADEGQYQYIPFTSATVFRKEGLDPAKPMSFDDRIRIQFQLLTHYEEQFYKLKGTKTVTDRSPLDLLAYLITEITPHSPDYSIAIKEYYRECVDLHNQLFSHTLLLQPGIPYVREEMKGNDSASYIFVLNITYRGLMPSVEQKQMICPTGTKEQYKRIKLIHELLNL